MKQQRLAVAAPPPRPPGIAILRRNLVEDRREYARNHIPDRFHVKGSKSRPAVVIRVLTYKRERPRDRKNLWLAIRCRAAAFWTRQWAMDYRWARIKFGSSYTRPFVSSDTEVPGSEAKPERYVIPPSRRMGRHIRELCWDVSANFKG